MPVIALIEDDPHVRIPLAHGLGEAGYKVIAATNGPDGLALLQGHNIDVAVVDVILPGQIDGIGIARQAKQHHPELKVILMSGGALPVDLHGIAHFVPKPIRLADLIARVRRVIDGDNLVDGEDMLMRAERVIQECGELAMFYSALRADEWRRYGDRENFRSWTRILAAVEKL